MYEQILPPNIGSCINFQDGKSIVIDNSIVPFIRRDSTGVNIWTVPNSVLTTAITKIL
jgi:isocitrate dehydrogenase